MRSRFAALMLALASFVPALTVTSTLVACSCSVSCRVIDPRIQVDQIRVGVENVCLRAQDFAAEDPELDEPARVVIQDKATALYMLVASQQTTTGQELLEAGWRDVRAYHDGQVLKADLELMEQRIYLDTSDSVQDVIDAALGQGEAP